jgi:hypothetical protein
MEAGTASDVLGRIAYHRAVNRIPVLQAGRTVIEGFVISSSVAVHVAACVVSSAALGLDLRLLVAAPFPLMLGGLLSPDRDPLPRGVCPDRLAD